MFWHSILLIWLSLIFWTTAAHAQEGDKAYTGDNLVVLRRTCEAYVKLKDPVRKQDILCDCTHRVATSLWESRKSGETSTVRTEVESLTPAAFADELSQMIDAYESRQVLPSFIIEDGRKCVAPLKEIRAPVNSVPLGVALGFFQEGGALGNNALVQKFIDHVRQTQHNGTLPEMLIRFEQPHQMYFCSEGHFPEGHVYVTDKAPTEDWHNECRTSAKGAYREINGAMLDGMRLYVFTKVDSPERKIIDIFLKGALGVSAEEGAGSVKAPLEREVVHLPEIGRDLNPNLLSITIQKVDGAGREDFMRRFWNEARNRGIENLSVSVDPTKAVFERFCGTVVLWDIAIAQEEMDAARAKQCEQSQRQFRHHIASYEGVRFHIYVLTSSLKQASINEFLDTMQIGPASDVTPIEGATGSQRTHASSADADLTSNAVPDEVIGTGPQSLDKPEPDPSSQIHKKEGVTSTQSNQTGLAEAWNSVQSTTSEAVLEAFISQSKGTVYNALANARLEELRKQAHTSEAEEARRAVERAAEFAGRFEAFDQPSVNEPTTCEALWHQRNALYHRFGYCFQSPKGIAEFGNAGCFRNQDDVWKAMGETDRQLIERIKETEARKC